MWLVYTGAWAFVGALSWVTTPVYLIREVGMSPLQLVLAGTALEVAYSVFEVPTGVVADLRGRRLSLVVAGSVSSASHASSAPLRNVQPAQVGHDPGRHLEHGVRHLEGRPGQHQLQG